MPVRCTRISTSLMPMAGSGMSSSHKPGPACAFTSAFTKSPVGKNHYPGDARHPFTCTRSFSFPRRMYSRIGRRKLCTAGERERLGFGRPLIPCVGVVHRPGRPAKAGECAIDKRVQRKGQRNPLAYPEAALEAGVAAKGLDSHEPGRPLPPPGDRSPNFIRPAIETSHKTILMKRRCE